MNFWWVNQNQTYDHEVSGGYMWSPQKKSNGSTNRFYDNMTRVESGDIVFSFADTRIKAIGVINGKAKEGPKPQEFGAAGGNWSQSGWYVPVEYCALSNQVRPADHMDQIGPTLPSKYSPIQDNGRGNQGCYLAAVPTNMANVLLNLIGAETEFILSQPEEEEQVANIIQQTNISETEKDQLIKSRKGQGLFRSRLEEIEKHCRVTKLNQKKHLIASHIKPWRDCSNEERLDGYNGLLLAPHIDHLFDKGFISFHDDGSVLFSSSLTHEVIERWHLDCNMNVGNFHENQKNYLDHHRSNIFKK